MGKRFTVMVTCPVCSGGSFGQEGGECSCGNTGTVEVAPITPLAELEEQAIRDALRYGLSASRVAEELGIGRSTLYRKLKKYGIEL